MSTALAIAIGVCGLFSLGCFFYLVIFGTSKICNLIAIIFGIIIPSFVCVFMIDKETLIAEYPFDGAPWYAYLITGIIDVLIMVGMVFVPASEALHDVFDSTGAKIATKGGLTGFAMLTLFLTCFIAFGIRSAFI